MFNRSKQEAKVIKSIIDKYLIITYLVNTLRTISRVVVIKSKSLIKFRRLIP